jgi:hypothetical protein
MEWQVLMMSDVTNLYRPTPIQLDSCLTQLYFGENLYDVWKVTVKGDAYARADEASKNLWTRHKRPGQYNDGILNSDHDPRCTERTGLLGEVAFASVMDLEVDFGYKIGGEKFDFKVGSGTEIIRIDVKTAYGLKSRPDRCLIRVKDKKRRYPLDCHVYVAAFLDKECRESQTAEVVLVGFQANREVRNLPDVLTQKTSRSWYNKELHYGELHSMSDLKKIVEKYRSR